MPRRPDFIDRFYSDVGKIAAVTDELSALAKRGIELAEAEKTAEARVIHARVEALDKRRLKLKAAWSDYLEARRG